LLWCAGVNGDKAVTPRLIALLKDQNLRIRMMSAMALGELSDPTARPALEQMSESDPHHYAKFQAKQATIARCGLRDPLIPHHYAKFQAKQALDRTSAKSADGAGAGHE